MTAKTKIKSQTKHSTKTGAAHNYLEKTSNQKIKYGRLNQLATRHLMWVALVVLAFTSLAWSFLSAQIQQANADQLSNSYLFSSWKVFHNASVPGAHTFLLKWPVFLIIQWLGNSSAVVQTLTVIISLVTIGGLAYVLYRINPNRLVFGFLLLCLASCLLLVPAQPYAGALLPVNMAMLATRNLEYLIYIGCLALLIRANSKQSSDFWLAIAGLALLIASDRLFLTLSLGGAVIGLVIALVRRQRSFVWLYIDWLIAGLTALVVSVGILAFINHFGIVHITSPKSASPYLLIHSWKQLVVGIFFALSGLLTNFGANPAFDATTLKAFFPHFTNGLFTSTGPVLIVNLAIFLWLVYLCARFVLVHLKRRLSKRTKDNPARLAGMLVWSSIAATIAFIATDHYYAVDARYLTIWLFTAFIVAAVQLRKRRGVARELAYAGWTILLGALLLGIFALGHTHRKEAAALQDVDRRNTSVSQILQSHRVDVLVGDYWRVLPIKDKDPSQDILPMESCFIPRTNLSSKAWQVDLSTHSFAYLLSLDKGLTDFPACNLDQIVAQYGRPNATTLVAGNLSGPKELLLFYDRGAHKSAPTIVQPKATTILPIPISELPNTACPGAPTTIMQIVAHQDDDLLFMNPDIMHDIQKGNCVRTVYLTAGDAGNGQAYWLARERGSQAAYAQMLGNDGVVWIQRTVKLQDDEFITVDNPRGNSRVSLIFFHLPDGNLRGEGFRNYRFQSLEQLERGLATTIRSVDQQSFYSRNDLISALTTLMNTYKPDSMRTQTTYSAGNTFPDHSDHMTAGWFAHQAAHLLGDDNLPIYDYAGYPSRERPENVEGQDFQAKLSAFLAYSQFDKGVCHTAAECYLTPTYGNYLKRQYKL